MVISIEMNEERTMWMFSSNSLDVAIEYHVHDFHYKCQFVL